MSESDDVDDVVTCSDDVADVVAGVPLARMMLLTWLLVSHFLGWCRWRDRWCPTCRHDGGDVVGGVPFDRMMSLLAVRHCFCHQQTDVTVLMFLVSHCFCQHQNWCCQLSPCCWQWSRYCCCHHQNRCCHVVIGGKKLLLSPPKLMLMPCCWQLGRQYCCHHQNVADGVSAECKWCWTTCTCWWCDQLVWLLCSWVCRFSGYLFIFYTHVRMFF